MKWDPSEKQHPPIREKQQPSLGTSQTLRIQPTVIFVIIIAESAACCPRNRDWKSGEDSVFLQAHRADLRKSWCSLMLQNHICRAGTRAAAPQKCVTVMKKTYGLAWLTCQIFSYLMVVSESGFSLIVLAESINFSLLQPYVCQAGATHCIQMLSFRHSSAFSLLPAH